MSDDGNRSCPCTQTTPCQPHCTCVDGISSHGCLRCCRYGSREQRRARAEWLAAAIDAALPPRDARADPPPEGERVQVWEPPNVGPQYDRPAPGYYDHAERVGDRWRNDNWHLDVPVADRPWWRPMPPGPPTEGLK